MTKDNLPKNSSAKWQDIPNSGSLDDFAKLTHLNSQSLKLTESDVLILPNNTKLSETANDKNLFAQTTKDILVALQNKKVEARLYEDGREKRELVLKSKDVILPILLFLKESAISVSLGILASWIYDRWIKTGVKQPPSIRVEYAEIDQSRSIIRWRKIEGPVVEVQQLLSAESNAIGKQDLASEIETSVAVHENDSSESQWDSQCKDSADAALAVAKDLIQQAENAINDKKMDVAEMLFRRSLEKIREALLWKPEEKTYSKYLHDIGRRIHDTFLCQLNFKDGLYWITCPVVLSHSKGGFSVGGSGKSICSICNKDVLECAHIKGHFYDNVVANRFHGICNICGQRECKHKEGEVYNGIQAFAVVTDLNLDHISFVQNPSNPLCVIQRYSVSKSELIEMLPEDEWNLVVYGETRISCHHCLICSGI